MSIFLHVLALAPALAGATRVRLEELVDDPDGPLREPWNWNPTFTEVPADPCGDPIACWTMFQHLNVTQAEFMQPLHEHGYNAPNWRNLWWRSPLEDLVELLQTPADDDAVESYVYKIRNALMHLRRQETKDVQRFKTELERIEMKAAMLQREMHLSTGSLESLKAVACPVIPCSVAKAKCNPFLLPADDMQRNILVFHTKFDVERDTTAHLDLASLALPKIVLDMHRRARKTTDVMQLVLQDRILGNYVAMMEVHLPQGQIKLNWFGTTECTDRGGPLLEWLLRFLGESGYKDISLEDDSKVFCTADGESHEVPLRIAQMLKADTPAEGVSFYESRGFRFKNNDDGYQKSKDVLNMPLDTLKRLLDCGTGYEAESKILKMDPGSAAGETVFQWLKQKNKDMKHGNSRACYELSHIATLFWLLRSPAHVLLKHTPYQSEECLSILRPYNESMLVFGQGWKTLIFQKNLTLS